MPAETPAAAPAASAPASTPSASPSPAASPAPASSSPATGTPAAGSGAAPAAAAASAPVKREDFQSQEQYSKALLDAELAKIPATAEIAAPDAEPAVEKPADAAAETTETDPAAAETKPADDETKPAEDELDFSLDEETPAADPEIISRLATENEEFGRLLDADPELKGVLFKTAREAAELKPYRELFPDVESAKFAHANAGTFVDVRDTFMRSTTPEGTQATLDKLAELSIERDEQGNPIIDPVTKQPKIGDDFYGFLDHSRDLGIEHDRQEIAERLKANRYANEDEKQRDEVVAAALDVLKDYYHPSAETSAASMPEELRQRAAELDRREQELQQHSQREKVSERQRFESELVKESQSRVTGAINRIFDSLTKQGAVIAPFLKETLPNVIGSELIKTVAKDPALKAAMADLQRLPMSADVRSRRLALLDKAVQTHLPAIARTLLKQAGVQVLSTQAQRRNKIDAQTTASRSEPKGSVAGAAPNSQPLDVATAMSKAEAHWQKANPGKPIDRDAKGRIASLATKLMTGQQI